MANTGAPRRNLASAASMPSPMTILLLIAMSTAWHPRTAAAHQAPSGWTYPSECCSQRDCAPISHMERHPDGSITVTTKHGTVTFPRGFRHRESPDLEGHACFHPRSGNPYCLFLAPGA